MEDNISWILIIVGVHLALKLIGNYANSSDHQDKKLMLAYLENNERNILKMEKDIDYLTDQVISLK